MTKSNIFKLETKRGREILTTTSQNQLDGEFTITINAFGEQAYMAISPNEDLHSVIESGDFYNDVLLFVATFLFENGYMPKSNGKGMIGDSHD